MSRNESFFRSFEKIVFTVPGWPNIFANVYFRYKERRKATSAENFQNGGRWKFLNSGIVFYEVPRFIIINFNTIWTII